MKDNHKSNMFCTSLSKLPVSIQLLQLLKYLWCSLPSKDTWITLFWRLVNRSVLRIKTDNFLSIERLLLEEGAPLVIQTHYLQLTFLVSLCHLANISIKRSFLFLWFVFFNVKKSCWCKTVLLLSRWKDQTQLLFLKNSIKGWLLTGSIIFSTDIIQDVGVLHLAVVLFSAISHRRLWRQK